MFRFFVNPEQIIAHQETNNTDVLEKSVVITGEDVQHITKSLRLKPGAKVIICDGQGTDYLVELVELNNNEVTARVLHSEKSKGEPQIQVTLLQGLPKSDKMDMIVQKTTELGVTQILPVETKRTIVKIDAKKAARRLERWQKIAEEASKQSDRGKIPQIGPIMSWKEILDFVQKEDFDLLFVAWEDADSLSIKGLIHQWEVEHGQKPVKITFLIGPEGGLEEKEVTEFVQLGGQPVTLGPRILRTETAGLTVLAMLMYHFEMKGCDYK